VSEQTRKATNCNVQMVRDGTLCTPARDAHPAQELKPHCRILGTPKYERLEQEDEWCQRNSPITIIRGTPDSHNCLIEHELISFHSELMSSRNEINRIVVSECFRDVSTEQEASTAGRKSPALYVCKSSGEMKSKPCKGPRIPSGSDQRRSHIGPS